MPSAPLLLDLFCGAGGAAMGYHRAGFRVLGVDSRPQRHYPFAFVQADAVQFMAAARMDRVAAIHASPPCQSRSVATPAHLRGGHPELIGTMRDMLTATGRPWVIENVPPVPGSEYLRPDLILCGCVTGLDELERERWFETSWGAWEMRAPCYHAKPVVVVTGHGRCRGMKGTGLAADWRRVMGIEWMTRDEMAQAIPPNYTQHVGNLLMEVVR
jgi:DNA (cytosine-5)-methyltransferase 1